MAVAFEKSQASLALAAFQALQEKLFLHHPVGFLEKKSVLARAWYFAHKTEAVEWEVLRHETVVHRVAEPRQSAGSLDGRGTG